MWGSGNSSPAERSEDSHKPIPRGSIFEDRYCTECGATIPVAQKWRQVVENLEVFLHEGASSLVTDGSGHAEYTQGLSVALEEVEVGHEVGHCCHVAQRKLVLHLQKLLQPISPLLVRFEDAAGLKTNSNSLLWESSSGLCLALWNGRLCHFLSDADKFVAT